MSGTAQASGTRLAALPSELLSTVQESVPTSHWNNVLSAMERADREHKALRVLWAVLGTAKENPEDAAEWFEYVLGQTEQCSNQADEYYCLSFGTLSAILLFIIHLNGEVENANDEEFIRQIDDGINIANTIDICSIIFARALRDSSVIKVGESRAMAQALANQDGPGIETLTKHLIETQRKEPNSKYNCINQLLSDTICVRSKRAAKNRDIERLATIIMSI